MIMDGLSCSDDFELLYDACNDGSLETVQQVLNNTPLDQRAALVNQYYPDDDLVTP
eukprot:m.106072 g.106072  ORF g.106072 m.106072 type:complete len:56 (+) comp15296_c1_seq6:216-383(+)